VNAIPTTTTLDNLWAEGGIDPCLVVFIANVKGRRSIELPCNNTFTQFLAREFMPWVQKEYSIRPAPERVVLIGSSYSALAASYACMEHPELFGNAVMLSGGFWWKPKDAAEAEWLTSQIRTRKAMQTRYYLAAGIMEISGDIIGGTRRFTNALKERGYNVTYAEYNGWHDYLCWQGVIPEALKVLLPKRR
jgi:enterochelin esterase-like enzyme